MPALGSQLILLVLILASPSGFASNQEYNRVSRIEDKGGSLEFIPGENGRIYLRVTNPRYGTRLIGDKNGYDDASLAKMIRSLDPSAAQTFCTPLYAYDYAVSPLVGLGALGAYEGNAELAALRSANPARYVGRLIPEVIGGVAVRGKFKLVYDLIPYYKTVGVRLFSLSGALVEGLALLYFKAFDLFISSLADLCTENVKLTKTAQQYLNSGRPGQPPPLNIEEQDDSDPLTPVKSLAQVDRQNSILKIDMEPSLYWRLYDLVEDYEGTRLSADSIRRFSGGQATTK